MEKCEHPRVTLDEITEYAAAYIELLVLASGVQSSGQSFSWTADHLRRAFMWASHLEKIVEDLSIGLVSRRALDCVLANLAASAKKYVGLPHLTASDFSSARKIFLQALLQAVVPDSDYLKSVTESLIRQLENEGESATSVKEEVSARISALRSEKSLMSFVESSVGRLIFEKQQFSCATSVLQIPPDRDNSNSIVEGGDEILFKSWERSAMEYVTAFSTVYKTAAANLIFNSGEEVWRRVLDTSRVCISSNVVGDVASETEIAVSSASSSILEFALAFSESRDLAVWLTASQPGAKLEITNNQEQTAPECQAEAIFIEILFSQILEKQVDLWWKLPPVLLAGMCASRLSLLKTYLRKVTNEAQVLGRSCKCPCHKLGKACPACQQCSNVLLEKLWCFGVYHPQLRTFQPEQVNSVCNYLLNNAQSSQSWQNSYTHKVGGFNSKQAFPTNL